MSKKVELEAKIKELEAENKKLNERNKISSELIPRLGSEVSVYQERLAEAEAEKLDFTSIEAMRELSESDIIELLEGVLELPFTDNSIALTLKIYYKLKAINSISDEFSDIVLLGLAYSINSDEALTHLFFECLSDEVLEGIMKLIIRTQDNIKEICHFLKDNEGVEG